MKNKKEVNERAEWKSQFGFLLSVLGSAIGLGNIWRFAYLAHSNGGGSFIIPYIVSLVVLGIPFVILEFALGHYYKASIPIIFRKYKKIEWAGWLPILISGVLLMYYPVILAWCVLFLIYSFNLSWGEKTEQFFYNDFLGRTNMPFNMGEIQLDILLAVFAIWAFVWLILRKGIKGLELANKIFMPILIIFISILVFWSFTLEGAFLGISTYLIFDFSKIWNANIWLEAIGQVFFSLSIGYGVMIAYSSYLPKKSNLTRSALITGFLDSGFAIFAGLAIFSILGFMATQSGKSINEVITSGPGLAFIIYPQALNIMAQSVGPFVAKTLGVIFFMCLLFAGLSSMISMVEAYIIPFAEKYNYTRESVITVGVIVTFLLTIVFVTGAGFYWLDIIDHFVVNYGLLLVGLLECLIVGWIFKIEVLRKHVNKVSTFQIGYWWTILIKLLIPLILFAIVINALEKEFKEPYGSYPIESLIILGLGIFCLIIMISFILPLKGSKKS